MASQRILIVEDEPNIVESLRFILERAGFDVGTVGNGVEALDQLRRQSFAVLILDIMLPGTSGFEVLKTVRGDATLSSLPVIVLTAKGQAQDRETALAIGANAFVTKPFSNAEIVERVRSLVGSQDERA